MDQGSCIAGVGVVIPKSSSTVRGIRCSRAACAISKICRSLILIVTHPAKENDRRFALPESLHQSDVAL